jgi:hypothetical protein
MKKFQLLLGAALVAAGFTSCKSETEQTAEKNVDRYIVYVDSIERLDAAERSANWAAIEAEYDRRLAEADAALADMENGDESRNRIEETKTRYITIRTESSSGTNNTGGNNTDTTGTAGTGMATPMALFGNSDTSFAWVNKDNILATYQKFYETYKSNADNYTKDEHNQIKAWYEALDERKNVVEKQGLSEDDNEKIAGLKLKFAPTFKWERMTADGPED